MCVCVCVRARVWVCERVVQGVRAYLHDVRRACGLKVEAGSNLKIRMKHTTMPRSPHLPASYSRTPHTHACTLNTHAVHASNSPTSRTPCMHVTYAIRYIRQAWHACFACVRGLSAIRAWLACVFSVKTWVTQFARDTIVLFRTPFLTGS